MVSVLQWAEIRRLVLAEGRSQREVARLTELARDTVAKPRKGGKTWAPTRCPRPDLTSTGQRTTRVGGLL